MNRTPRVVIVMARCRHNAQAYGIRFEQNERGAWIGDWAFAVKEDRARREGYDRGEITGDFDFAPAYPGCPYCHDKGLFKCLCGKVACWDITTRAVTCPSCRAYVNITSSVHSLSAGGDR